MSEAVTVGGRSERTIIFLVAAVNFVNVLDFMMVMPLGPVFATALNISASDNGYIAGAYTATAAVAGFVGSFFLDRFDRRKALAVAMFGLVLATALGGFATGLPSLMAARMLAGAFGGPATSLSFSIVADVIPAERRGKALGAVMGAFSIASVIGVPIGMWLAERGGFRLPFFAVGGVGFVVAAAATFLLPSLRGHLARRQIGVSSLAQLRALLANPMVIASYTMTATVMMSSFIVVPNLAPYLQFNLEISYSHVKWLYVVGGAASFLALRFALGPAVDRYGSFRVGTIGAALVAAMVWLWLVGYQPWMPVIVMFVLFMLSMSVRNVAYNTLTSRVPRPEERARFQSIQSSVQHMASALGAFLSSRLLTENPATHALQGLSRVAYISIGLSMFLPWLLWRVERKVKRAAANEAVAAVAKVFA